MVMKGRRWRLCRPQALRYLTTVLCLSVVCWWYPAARMAATGVDREIRSPCRSDMEVNWLPPIADDNDKMLDDFFTYFMTPNKRACRRVLKFGGEPPRIIKGNEGMIKAAMDGAKYVCMDPEFSLLSTDDCLIYSFGIGNDWSFDWDMERFGCTVYAFDPSINTTTGSQGGNILFLQYGIGDKNFTDERGWPLRTLDFYVKKLDHSHRTIHYLKLDVEGMEWYALRQQMTRMRESTLFNNVAQLGLELHFVEIPVIEHLDWFREMYHVVLQMQQMGFFLFSFERNPVSKRTLSIPGRTDYVPTVMEVVWLKSKCVKDRNIFGAREVA